MIAWLVQVKSGGKVLWLMIVLASLAVATVFIRASIQVQLLAHTRRTSPCYNQKFMSMIDFIILIMICMI